MVALKFLYLQAPWLYVCSNGDQEHSTSSGTPVHNRSLGQSSLGYSPLSENTHSRAFINIQWIHFTSWSDSGGTISGTMSVQSSYKSNTLRVDELSSSINARNFASGAPGRVQFGKMDVDRINITETSLHLVGDFKQSVSGKCLPFDEQTAQFVIEIPPPFGLDIDVHIFCFRPSCSMFDASGSKIPSWNGPPPLAPEALNVTRIVDVATEGEYAVGFTWTKFTCDLRENKIVCEMIGTRDQSRYSYQQLLPGVVMSLVSFSSYWIPVNMPMPRIATTMIALMTFVGKATTSLHELPTSGTSFVEHFYTAGLFSMFLNLVGHILSFRHPEIHHFIDDVSTYVAFLFLLLVLLIELRSKDCKEPDPDVLTGLIVAVVIMIVTSSYLILKRRKQQLLLWWAQVSSVMKQGSVQSIPTVHSEINVESEINV